MSGRWVRKYKFDRPLKEYFVTCFELVTDDEDRYGLNEYEISIRSWHADLHRKDCRIADSFSEHRYKMTFRDKNTANRVYLWIVKTEPNYEQLKKVGFTHSTW